MAPNDVSPVSALVRQRWLPMDGRMVRVLRFTHDQDRRLLVVLETEDGSIERHSYAAWCAQVSTAAAGTASHDALREPESAEWDDLPKIEQTRCINRARDLLQMHTGSPTGRVDRDRAAGVLDPRFDPEITSLEERVAAKGTELKGRGEKGVSRAQLLVQWGRLTDQGLMGLVHGHHRRSLPREVPDEVRAALEMALERRGASAKVGIAALAVLMRADLEQQGLVLDYQADEWIAIVGEASRGMGLHREARSRRTRNNKPDRVYGRHLVSRPGEIVQIDASPTTIHCFLPDVGWTRASVLTAIDVYSRCILALRVVPKSPTSRDVGMLLWDIGRPQITRAGYPYELDLWHGVPRLVSLVDDPDPGAGVIGAKPAVTTSTVVLDHGRENESLHLMSAAAQVGISIVYSPPAAPHTKGVVEAWHNSLDRIQSLLPAYKGASVANHPDGVEHEAVLTVGDLHDALWEYVLQVYHHSQHEGLRDPVNTVLRPTPAEVFERFLEHGGELPLPQDPWRMLNFLSRAACTVQDYGINLENRIYNSPELLELRDHYQRGMGAARRSLTVYYDRLDISRVYARHPLGGHWIMIPRWDPAGVSIGPCSELVSDAAKRALRDEGIVRPDPTQLQVAEAKLARAWAAGVFKDRRDERLAAVERARTSTYAHDLGDATPAIRDLAYPPYHAVEPAADEVFDPTDELEDDDLPLYDDFDVEVG